MGDFFIFKEYDLGSMDNKIVDSEFSDEKKLRSEIRNISPWFGKVKNIWMKVRGS